MMGVANVVPGISGGAMLLLIGVYQRFITAVAEVTTLKLRWRSIVFLGLIACGAGLAILLTAGPIKNIILSHRWQVFSLFIGLRLGAIPLVMRWAKPMNAKVWAGIVAGLVITAGLATAQYLGDSTAGGESTTLTRFAAGLAGASATILPGMDGSYFLLLMGEYVPILSAIERTKDALLAFDVAAVWKEGLFLLPVAVGVALGLGGVSVALRWLFQHHRGAVAGVLLGVLVGAIGGLWPFRVANPPQPGETIKGVLVTAENAATFTDPEDWKMVFFTPTATQVGLSIAFVLLGVAIAWGFSKIDPEEGRLEATQEGRE